MQPVGIDGKVVNQYPITGDPGGPGVVVLTGANLFDVNGAVVGGDPLLGNQYGENAGAGIPMYYISGVPSTGATYSAASARVST